MTGFHRRQFLHFIAGAATLPAVSQVARAQSFPTRPVMLIVPFEERAAQTTSLAEYSRARQKSI